MPNYIGAARDATNRHRNINHTFRAQDLSSKIAKDLDKVAAKYKSLAEVFASLESMSAYAQLVR
jgi:hypothetical protein